MHKQNQQQNQIWCLFLKIVFTVVRWWDNLDKHRYLVPAAAAGSSRCQMAATLPWKSVKPRSLAESTAKRWKINSDTEKREREKEKGKKWSASGRVCSLSPEVAPAALRAAALNVSPLSGTQQLVMRPKLRNRLLTGSSTAAICLQNSNKWFHLLEDAVRVWGGGWSAKRKRYLVVREEGTFNCKFCHLTFWNFNWTFHFN